MGEAANGKDAMDQIEKLQPQIVISDVVMPLMDGVDFTVAVHHRYPHIQMIILSGYDNFEYVKQTLMQGVDRKSTRLNSSHSRIGVCVVWM